MPYQTEKINPVLGNLEKELMDSLGSVDLMPVVSPIFDNFVSNLRKYGQENKSVSPDMLERYIASISINRCDFGVTIDVADVPVTPPEALKQISAKEFGGWVEDGSAAKKLPASHAWYNIQIETAKMYRQIENCVEKAIYKALK